MLEARGGARRAPMGAYDWRKFMYEGVNASDGIGIGVARVAVEPDLSFTPHAPEDAKAEEAVKQD